MKAVVLGAAAGGGLQAVEILRFVDGKTGVGAVVDSLVGRYTQAPRELIAKEVTASGAKRTAYRRLTMWALVCLPMNKTEVLKRSVLT